jgi:energy-coupling factor transporter ATP-binding protein EcfA2
MENCGTFPNVKCKVRWEIAFIEGTFRAGGGKILGNMPIKPGYFDRLCLRNVRCFSDADIKLDKRVTVIVGGNASGKTTLMEALASITHGEEEGLIDFPLRYGTNRGQIELYEDGEASAIARWNSEDAKRQRLPSDRFVFLYGRYRRVLVPEETEGPRNLSDHQYLDELSSHAGKMRTTTLTRADNRLLQDLAGYVRGLNLGRRSDPRLEPVWARLNQALPELDDSFSEIHMESGPSSLIPKVIRKGVPLELTQLSDGFQAILVIVLDLILRFAFLFVEGDPLQGRALVGVDEIDLHLHPRLQRTVLHYLTNVFPNSQFLLTTHSPIVVQSAIDQGFTVLRLTEKNGEVKAPRLSPKLMKALRGAEVGSLLFEEHLFGVDSRFSVEFSELEKRVDELREKVGSGEPTKDDYLELKRGLDQLEQLVVDEDRRRASGSTMAQMVGMQAEFVKALMDELEKARK